MGFKWVTAERAIQLHDRTLAAHGGRQGFKNRGDLESALHRAEAFNFYENVTDVPTLCFRDAEGIIKNHPFTDGNKRTAFLVCSEFAITNGFIFLSNMSATCVALEAFADKDRPDMDSEQLRKFVLLSLMKLK